MPLFKLDHRPCLILYQFSSPRLPVVTVIVTVTRHSSPVSRLVDISYDSLLTLGNGKLRMKDTVRIAMIPPLPLSQRPA
jgi:hypothetical protein